jgi:hypothetical protein
MAMNGINLVYATTGMEYIFSKVSVFAFLSKISLDCYVRYFYEWVSINQNWMIILQVLHFWLGKIDI